ncbi:hypothetical protein [Idiomarina ramblicola]|uniref:Uncharacterized protein n=1 Tax=Idiomarina ramblicola TaxID=263724 RepID=A0A432YYA5_9GAMM|nr:hypothetical protein [Idiomarina ramblicola]RUO68362.1 hypothetical protein CWI78_09080 [Idiomarina ramblicola]
MRILFVVLLSVSTLLLTGCSSRSQHSGVALYEIDRGYVDAVNREARMGGTSKVDVYWVNPPVKKKAESNEPPL